MRTNILWFLKQSRLSTSAATLVVMTLSTACSKQSNSKSPAAKPPTVLMDEEDAEPETPHKKPKKESQGEIEESTETKAEAAAAEAPAKKTEKTPPVVKTTTTPSTKSTGTSTQQTPPPAPKVIDPEVGAFACQSKMTAPQIIAWVAKDNPAPGMTAAQFANIKMNLEGTTEAQLADYIAEKCPPM